MKGFNSIQSSTQVDSLCIRFHGFLWIIQTVFFFLINNKLVVLHYEIFDYCWIRSPFISMHEPNRMRQTIVESLLFQVTNLYLMGYSFGQTMLLLAKNGFVFCWFIFLFFSKQYLSTEQKRENVKHAISLHSWRCYWNPISGVSFKFYD